MITLITFMAGACFIIWGLYLFFADREESKKPSVVVKPERENKEQVIEQEQQTEDEKEIKNSKEIVIPLMDIAKVFWKKGEHIFIETTDTEKQIEKEKLDEKVKEIIKIRDDETKPDTEEKTQEVQEEKQEAEGKQADKKEETAEETQNKETDKAVEEKALSEETNKTTEEKTSTEDKTITEVLAATVLKETEDFFNQCIKPYKEIIVKQFADVLIERLIAFIEENRHHSSVCLGMEDDETQDLYTVKDTLAKVTLREHTYTVVRELVDLVKQNYRDRAAESVMPFYLVCGLAHDIGKKPEIRLTGLYGTHLHATCSANKLRELAEGCNIAWIDKAMTVVMGHHGSSEMQEIKLLKKADHKARSLELARFTKDYEVGEFKRYFDEVEFFRDYILPEVNNGQKGLSSDDLAVTLKGILFIRPISLYNQMKKMGQDKKKLDVSFVYKTETDNTNRRIVALLREKGFVHEMLPEGRYAMFFKVKTSRPMPREMKLSLVPLKLDKLLKIWNMQLIDIERKKTDVLMTINDLVAI